MVEPVTPPRGEVVGGRHAVAASNPTIAAAGSAVLAGGGNAIDATLAMAAVGWMCLPGQCGIGGDAFALVREPDGRVWTVGGSGFGPDGASGGSYRDRGMATLPLGGALSVAVPGAVAALRTLHSGGATRPLDRLWAPAVVLGREGFACTAKTRADIAEHAASLAGDAGAARTFLPGGSVPRIGRRIYQRELADTIERVALAHARGDDIFYSGEIAERAVAALNAGGAPFSGEEWDASGEARPQPALEGTYAGARLLQTPMPTPGWMVLQQAGVLDGELGGVEQLGDEAVHWLAEAARGAFQDRYASCSSDTETWRTLLTSETIAATRRRIAAGRATLATPVGVEGDTTTTVCVDGEGRAVSFIHSLAFTFGARVTVSGTGVLLNNRLARGAYLIDGHPNELRPRRKPLHTLNAWMVEDASGLRHVGNCPGGDGQVQWNMQVISHLMDHGDGPQRAVSLPRVTVFPGSDADVIGRPDELRCEPGLSMAALAGLERRGHRVVPVPLQVGGPGGSALVISRDPDQGALHVGVDPRMEGVGLAV